MKTCCLLAIRSTTGTVSSVLLVGIDRTGSSLGTVRFNSLEELRDALRETVFGEGDERLAKLVQALNSEGSYGLGELLLTDDQVNALGLKRPNED